MLESSRFAAVGKHNAKIWYAVDMQEISTPRLPGHASKKSYEFALEDPTEAMVASQLITPGFVEEGFGNRVAVVEGAYEDAHARTQIETRRELHHDATHRSDHLDG